MTSSLLKLSTLTRACTRTEVRLRRATCTQTRTKGRGARLGGSAVGGSAAAAPQADGSLLLAQIVGI